MSKLSWFRRSQKTNPKRSARPNRRSMRFERLEDRRLLTTTPITVEINGFIQLEDPEGSFDPSDTGNFYPIIQIADHDPVSFINQQIESKLIEDPGWSLTENIELAVDQPVDVVIWMYDDDELSDDDLIDIHSEDAELVQWVQVDPFTGEFVGGNFTVGFGGLLVGEGDGDTEHFPYTLPGFASGVGEGGHAGFLSASIHLPYLGEEFPEDTDDDGLYDHWETNGIDFNQDGFPELNLPLLGADPNHKDLFVEVDAMAGLGPSALPDITQVFKAGGGFPIDVTSTGHGLTTGTRVTISGVPGDSPANGTFTVTRVNDNVFSLDGTEGGPGFGPTAVADGVANWTLTDLEGTELATGTSLDLVINSFLNAPVDNPDGSTGINLHIELDETTVTPESWDSDEDDDTLTPYGEDQNADGVLGEDSDGDGRFDRGTEDLDGNGVFDPGEDLDGDGNFDNVDEDANGNGTFDMDEDTNGNFVIDFIDTDETGGWLYYKAFKDVRFGTPEQRNNVDTERILDAKRLAFRYNVFAHSFVDTPHPVTGRGVTNGRGGMAYTGVDFIVTLGNWNNTPQVQAETFMHELGHTLGLGHGGGDGINYKPNYHSVMNYLWGNPMRSFASWELDYSEGTFGILRESALDEPEGLRGDAAHAGHFVIVGPPTTPATFVPEVGPVNWNGNGSVMDLNVARDLNRPLVWLPASPGQVLKDHDDWSALKLGFGDTGFRFGDTAPQDLPIELTFEEVLLARQAVNTPPSINSIVFDNASIDESETITVTGTFDDSGLGIDTFTGSAVWSDGVNTSLMIDGTAGTFSTERVFPDDDPAGTSFDVFTVEITLEDDNGGSDSQTSAELTVNNIAPSIIEVSLSENTIYEGQLMIVSGSFDDPALGIDSFVGTALWSDGVSTALAINGTAGTFSTERLFADDDPTGTLSDMFTVEITIDDDDMGSDSAISPILTVLNVAPSINGVFLSSDTIEEGETVEVTGSFDDPALGIDTFNGTAVWSDGEETLLSIDGTQGTFSTERFFADDNPTGTPSDTFTVEIAIHDDDTGSDSASSPMLTVLNVAPEVSFIANSAEASGDVGEQEAVTLNLNWSDPGLLDTFTARIEWGDGSENTYDYSAATSSLSESHVYEHGGVFQIVATLTDDDTGQAVAVTTAYITGVGIVGDRLYVVGTNTDDQVIVNPTANNDLRVHASFLPERQRTFSTEGLSEIVMVLRDGDDLATVAGSIELATQMHGGGGSDRLNGGGGFNILLGGLGDDRLLGGRKEDLLIGGDGSDELNGNHSGNLLVAGTTAYDGVALEKIDRLFEILGDYADDGQLSVENIFDETTVFDDDFTDDILGSSKLDQIWYELGRDRVKGHK